MLDAFRSFLPVTLLTSFLALWSLPLQAAIEPAGHVILSNGTFLAIQSDDSTRSLSRGSEFYQGDRLWTGPSTKAQVRFSDGAIMTLRPDTEFSVDEYEFDDSNAGRNKSLFTLIKGGFRTLTGLISRLKPDGYKVKTAYAIVGVRGTTWETVLDRNDGSQYIGVWGGGVRVETEGGQLDLGFGEEFNFARVTSSQQSPRGLILAPPELLDPVDPNLQELVQGPATESEVLPIEADLNQLGFATFGGQSSPAPLAGAATSGAEGSPLIVDAATGQVLRQGNASVLATSNPLPGVSWGAWAGGSEVDTVAGATTINQPVFWLTMAPPTAVPIGAVRSYSKVVDSGGSGNLGAATVSSFNATVNFGTSSISGGMQVVNGTNTWDVSYSGGTVNGSRFNVPSVTGTINATSSVNGGIAGGFTGAGANTIGGAFDFEEGGVPTTHVEGVFVAQ